MSDQTSELTALEKHACPACGARAEWNPGEQRLICSYCGTEAPYEVDPESGEIQEIDLVKTLRELPDEMRGWNVEKRAVRCRSCRAVSVFDPERVGQNCEFRGSPELVDYEELKPPIRPSSLLPFKITESQVRESIRGWYRSRWFAPNALKSRALTDTVHGLYIPYWTFDTSVYCPWSADAGHYYYMTMNKRQARRVRWERVNGVIEHFFDDHPVPGTRGIEIDLLRRVEPFPTHHVFPYDTAYLSGFVVEHYQIVLIEAVKLARESMRVELKRMAAESILADTHRNLTIFPSYSAETFKHVLVPVWLLSYDYGSRNFQVVVNGYTGRMAGKYPKSWWKILALAVSLAFIAALLVWLEAMQF